MEDSEVNKTVCCMWKEWTPQTFWRAWFCSLLATVGKDVSNTPSRLLNGKQKKVLSIVIFFSKNLNVKYPLISELQIRADFKKMRSYSGIAFRTQISLAIIRKDNKGYKWETCMQFSQWKEEDFNIPKVNMTSEKPLYDACCPDKNKSRENTTYAWRWSEHPWTETTIEPWRDIDIIRQIPTDERCLTNTTV